MNLLSRWYGRLGRWAWLPALACGAAGLIGLDDLDTAVCFVQVMVFVPHLFVAGLAACAGRHSPTAGIIALFGAVLMACMWYFDLSARQTEGFEYRFNNAMGAVVCCGANFLILMVTTLAVVSVVLRALNHPPKDEIRACSA